MVLIVCDNTVNSLMIGCKHLKINPYMIGVHTQQMLLGMAVLWMDQQEQTGLNQ